MATAYARNRRRVVESVRQRPIRVVPTSKDSEHHFPLMHLGCAAGDLSLSLLAHNNFPNVRRTRRLVARSPASRFARRTLDTFMRHYPGLTISEVRSSLRWNASYLDRTCEGLEQAGMRP